MKILINCSTLKKGGVLQVAHSFVSELLQRSDHDYYFIFSSALKKDLQTCITEDFGRFFIYDVKPSVFLSLTGHEKKLNVILSEITPDIIFSMFGPTYWNPKCLHLCGYAKASYFYPDSPYIQNMPLSSKFRLFILKKLHLYDFKHFNQGLVTETTDASYRLQHLLPEKKVFTVSNTYNQVFDNPDTWDTSLRLPVFEGITLLSITANYKHKNLSVVPDVIDYLTEKYPAFKFRFVFTLNEGDIKHLDAKSRNYISFLAGCQFTNAHTCIHNQI